MPDRRYNDEEMAAIFRAAAEEHATSARGVPPDEGLTLSDLQAIGREVGIAPDAVAQAARVLDATRAVEARTWLGLPLGVSRTVDLNRRVSDEEWDRLVVQLREVFQAVGRTHASGSLRQWTNGNLRVLLEPTATGHRLRFGTLHGAARASINAGLAALGVTAVTAFATAIAGSFADALPGIALLATAGFGLLASGVLRLPRWARMRRRQMEALAAQMAALPDTPSPPALSSGAVPPN